LGRPASRSHKIRHKISPDAPITAAHPADGRRHADLPVEAYAVVPGTNSGAADDELTPRTREKKTLQSTTLEPLEAGNGIYLPLARRFAAT